MLKRQLDAAVADELACPSSTVATVTSLFLRRVMEAVATGRVVVLPGIGKFTLGVSKRPGSRNLLQNKDDSRRTTRRSTSTTVHFAKSRHLFTQLRDEGKLQSGKICRR
jgi:nucleoid DNA-binding protein